MRRIANRVYHEKCCIPGAGKKSGGWTRLFLGLKRELIFRTTDTCIRLPSDGMYAYVCMYAGVSMYVLLHNMNLHAVVCVGAIETSCVGSLNYT